MYGLEAIQTYNGWAMAITGAVIVMIGLTILSFIISQLHRIIDIVDNRNDRKAKKLNARSQTAVSESQAGDAAPFGPERNNESFQAIDTENR